MTICFTLFMVAGVALLMWFFIALVRDEIRTVIVVHFDPILIQNKMDTDQSETSQFSERQHDAGPLFCSCERCLLRSPSRLCTSV